MKCSTRPRGVFGVAAMIAVVGLAGDDLDGVPGGRPGQVERLGARRRQPAARRARCGAPSASRRAPTGRARRRRSGRARTSGVRACASGATPMPRRRAASAHGDPADHPSTIGQQQRSGEHGAGPHHPRQCGEREIRRAAGAADGGPRRRRRMPARRRARVARWRRGTSPPARLATNRTATARSAPANAVASDTGTASGTTTRVAVRLTTAGTAIAATPITQSAAPTMRATSCTLSERSSNAASRAGIASSTTAIHAPRSSHGTDRSMRCAVDRAGTGDSLPPYGVVAPESGDVTMIGWCDRTPQSRRVRLSGPPG